MEGHGLSQRRACRLVGIGHSTLRYQRRRAHDDVVRKRLRELAAQRRRFGYRRLGWLLAREGHAMNHKKLYRLYPEQKLAVCRASSINDNATEGIKGTFYRTSADHRSGREEV